MHCQVRLSIQRSGERHGEIAVTPAHAAASRCPDHLSSWHVVGVEGVLLSNAMCSAASRCPDHLSSWHVVGVEGVLLSNAMCSAQMPGSEADGCLLNLQDGA